ncbi:Uncharacterized protein BM_BM1560 [Brugia malayi]|uniref:Bridge-like lipid transfer protein family member 1 C-terminal domain-containing protein n=1 Tax=Brugia malayi TaxID=6279 RepID=A0A4E9F036_BRUMA|nr:Uncharacterized protein BM_BM1560 [Brugia malayi]VIO89935.1 Uncharacterized protein BM_BM1560 [Brugia malayi]
MGSGFKVLQNATLKAIYRSSIFADSSSIPICDLNIDFGENVAIAYGPWAEACRSAFVSYFFPTDFTDAKSVKLPENSDHKIPQKIDITLTMNGRTTINLWFMRHDELNTMTVIIKNGLSISIEKPLITTTDDGYKTKIQFNMNDVQFLLTSGFRKLISYDEMTVQCDIFIPKQYGQIQNCQFLIKMNRVTTWCIWDHIVFMQDFISEISSYYTEDLAQFVPQIWNCQIEFTNAKFIFVVNDKNWVDASNPSSNFLIALFAKQFTISCNFNKTDFCPQICHCNTEMVASESVAIKFHIPQRSTLSSVVHTLYDNSFHFIKISTTNFDFDTNWLDFLRTQQITFTYNYTWHPIYLPYKSDLPLRIKPIANQQYPAHPFELEPDSAQIKIIIQPPEIFVSGFALWIVKNYINDYFGSYSQQQSDMDSYDAHALLSRRLYGHVKHEIEKYRPLDLKLSIQFQDAHGHCLIHTIKTTGKNPDICPTMKINIMVVEIVRKIRDLRFQIFISGLQIFFRKSESIRNVQDGHLSIDQIAIRMNAFSSELNIPWDAGAVEYACGWEIIIGQIVTKIDPIQLVCIAQMLESFLLLITAIDEELLIPQMYDICQHMNDVRTCPISNLQLVDLENRAQNCERAKNLKYILFRASIDLINIIIMEDLAMICISMEPWRICTCNCHELSFCASFLFGILQLDIKQFIKYSLYNDNDNKWLECGSIHFQDIEFEIRLPFASKNLYLINERKKFLKMHDEYTKRLYFLWLNETKCGCYGSFAFFGEDDLSGCIFMADFMQKLTQSQINNEPKQPGFGQSIIQPSTKLFENNDLNIINFSNEHKIFLTPLSIEVIQRLTERAEMILTALNPISIIQHTYASCAFKCHKQPINEKNNLFIQDSLLPEVNAHFGLPPVYITFFQGARIDDELLRNNANKDNCARSTKMHCTVTMIYGRECYLNVFTNNQNNMQMICFDTYTLYHAQFAKIIYTREKKRFIDNWKTNFLTNWDKLDLSKRLRHSKLIILSELNVPNILLKGFINRQNLLHWINGSEIIIRTGEPRLRISSGDECLDKQSDIILLKLAVASSLISWFHVLRKFQKSIHHTLVKYNEWLDLCMLKALSEALDLRDDLILTLCKSSLNDVKRYAMVMNACASCMLMHFLLHCTMNKDENERFNYWMNHSFEFESITNSRFDRKFALISLLNLWHQLLAPHVKVSNLATAKKYSRDLPSENMKSMTAAGEDKSIKQTIGTTVSVPVSGSIANSGVKGITENLTVKQFNTLPSIFFWPIFKIYHLDTNILFELPVKRIHFSFKFMIGEFKIYLVELIRKKNQTIQQQSFLFLLLDTITVDSAIIYNILIDKQQLNAIKTFLTINFETLFPRIELFCTQTVLHLLNELFQSVAYCMTVTPTVTSVIHLDDTQNSISKTAESVIVENSERKQQKWIVTLLNLFRKNKMNNEKIEKLKSDIANFSITINNNIVISAIKFESKIMHLILMLRIFNSKLQHNNEYLINEPKKTIQEVSLAIQDIKMMITEKGTTDINIFHGSLTTVTSTFRRVYEANNLLNTICLTVENIKLNYIIGSSFMITADDKKDSDNDDNDKEDYQFASSVAEQQWINENENITKFNFDMKLLHGEMNAKISSNVTAKYNFKNAHCFGTFPKKGTISIENHFITYTSFYSKKIPKWMRLGNFSIKLPSLLIVYEKCIKNENEIIQIDNKEIICSNESYANIVITAGSFDQSINTDVLNMLLYSHETAIAEFEHIMSIVRSSTAFHRNSIYNSSFLFQLQMQCENVSPWLKLTLTDTTNTALRITTEVVNMFIIGRNILNNNKNIFEKQIRGNVSFCLNFKLGHMIRNEAFEEDELRELADLTTNLTCILQFSPRSIANAIVIFSHTVILFKFPAIIRAKDILRDFSLSRSFWMKQKMRHTTQTENDSSQMTSHSSLLDMGNRLIMRITLLFRDRTIACIPLYSNNYRSFTSALLFGVKDAEATVKFVRGAKAEAKFSDFKIVFVENFENSMEESWIDGQENTPTNFTFFPHGVCKIVVKFSKSEQYKRVASVQCSMKGLIFDIDSRIGSLIGAVWNTCATINEDQDVDVSEYEPMKIMTSEIERNDDINLKNEYASIVKPEKRIRWVEQKIYEQTQKLKSHITDVTYEWELRRLKKLQLIRVKQFKESMLDRLKRQKSRGKQLKKAPVRKDKTKDEDDAEEKSDSESVTGEQSTKFLREITSIDQPKSNTVGSSLKQHKIPAKINDNAMKADEKMNDGSFVFDMQFFGEAGECMLRNRISTEFTSTTSATPENNFKRHDDANEDCTKISLPSIEAKIYYSTNDAINCHKSFPIIKSANTSMPYLYVSANVANMPEETALTPIIADFFQQLLENLPQKFPQQSENESDTISMTDTESLLTCIHSKLMINILLSITIQSSSLRFEAHQQRAGAMDLLLRLPSLKLVASAHNDTINNEFDISLNLQSFSVCFYNPHQPSPLDAFALTLDNFTVGISRTSIFLHDNSHLKIACTIDIGQATFTYDMRKLSQLIAFPGPWYRRRIAQRFLLKHEQLSKTQSIGTGRSFSKRTRKMMDKLMLEASINIHWDSFKAKIQMSSAMGDTNWLIDKISTKIIFCLQPFVERRLNIYFGVSFLEQEAKGGAISGSLQLANAAINFSWISLCNQPTSFSSKINFNELKIQIIWMGRVVIVVLIDQSSLLLNDDWKLYNDQDEKIKEAMIMLNSILKYSKLQAIITKATFNSIDSVIQKLSVFFKEQVEDSRVLHNLANKTLAGTIKNVIKLSQIFHWAKILDLVTDMQMRSKTFPMPNASNGRTIICGQLISIGQQASLVLMEGEITANRWALFYLNQPTLIFSSAAQYTFLDEKQTIGIDLSEKLLLKLNDATKENQIYDNNWTSVICKVERHKDQTCPKYATIQECLTLCIDEPLAQLFSLTQNSIKFQSMVLELFELPAMDSIFTSNQKVPIHLEKLKDIKTEVLCSLICDFHHALGVQTDLSTQINFLPELLRSYLIEQDKDVKKEIGKLPMEEKLGKGETEKTDKRQYICKQWKVDPKIRFIDKVKWDPPVIDEILRKLQIFDHRNTIPKVVQRHILDHCDMFLSKILLAIVKVAKEASVKSDRMSTHF